MVFFQVLRFSVSTFFLVLFNLGIFSSNEKRRRKALSKILNRCGPAFIKFAQLLSTRPDIVGDKIAADLQVLQDRVESFGSSEIDKIFKKNYGSLPGEMFLEFEYEPTAAASIAQVHKARMKNGNVCAVKILRPNIKKKIEKNILLLRAITNYIHENYEKFNRFRLPEIVNLLSLNLHHEIDMTFEAANSLQLKNNLRNDPDVYVPEVYWDLTRVDVLVMEWIEGIPLNRLDENGLSQAHKRVILKNLINTFCNQAYRDGVFHADMHPGNVLVDKNGRILLTDFGIIGRMDKKTKFYITEILRGFLKRDYKLIAEIHFEAGYVSKNNNIYDFENACRALGSQIVGKDLSEISIGRIFTGLLKLTNDFQMETRLELLLIQKATVLLEGVSSAIDKKINIWQLSDEWLRKHYMTFGRIAKMRVRKYVRILKENFQDWYSF
jgi:ubiquinone biosynthesis protein